MLIARFEPQQVAGAASSRRSTSLRSGALAADADQDVRGVGDHASDAALDQPDHRPGVVHRPGVERLPAPTRGADEAIAEHFGVHAQPVDVEPAGIAECVGHQRDNLEPGIGPPGLHQTIWHRAR